MRSAIVFKNHPPSLQSNVNHPHSQLIATPFTPAAIASELKNSRDYYYLKERCLFCDILDQEISEGLRLVSITEHFAAFCPYAPSSPFEVRITPRRHLHDFRKAGPELLDQLAVMLSDVMKRLYNALDDPPYAMYLYSCPNPKSGSARKGYWSTIEYDYHWHLDILPYAGDTDGFGLGSGSRIISVAPETAAEALREANGAK